MKTIFRITTAELRYLFCSPVAWLILIIFAIQTGMEFADTFEKQVQGKTMGYDLWSVTSGIFTGWLGIFPKFLPNLYLYIPLLTMGLMSREYSSGSIKLLFSSPITDSQIILGKYCSVLIYNLALIAPLLIIATFCGATIKHVNMSLILTGILGFYLLISAYGAIGLFMSSITSYQVVAAVGTLVVLAVLNYIGEVGQAYDFIRDITYWLSISGRAYQFIMGMICSEDVLYFLIVIILFISLSILKLRAGHKKDTFAKTWGTYALVICAALFVGYLSSLPSLKFYYDATATKSNTLTQESQDIMKQMDGDLKITTYVNLLDDNYHYGMPYSRKEDHKRFEQYIRFKPEMEMDYVYYWDESTNSRADERFEGLTLEEKAKKMCNIIAAHYNMFMTPEQIKEKIDLSAEGNRFLRIIERGNGQKTILRLYEDNEKHPSEKEISAALKRFLVKSPKVAFITGHDMRNISNTGDRDFNRFAQDMYFRYSLTNQGFDIITRSLSQGDIPEDIDIIVMADMKSPLNSTEMEHLQRYIDRGGNLFILGDVRRQEAMNPIVQKFGITYQPGILVNKHKDDSDSPTLVIGRITEEAAANFKPYFRPRMFGYVVTMPGTTGLSYDPSKWYAMIPVITTDDTYWNEQQTTDFVDDVPAYNPEKGEVQQSYPTIVALHRQVNGKEQRVVITGDADCISNGELGRSHGGHSSSNFTVITGTFRWLSYDEYPLDTERKRPMDNDINITKPVFKWAKFGFYAGIPLILAAIGITIRVRRKRN